MKISPFFLIAVASVLFASHAPAASLDDAHRAFAEGKYHDSTQGYQAVLAEKGYSAPVLFDLGNSLFREGNAGQAILAYKQAQWLSPNDPDIAANLELAQKQAGVAVAEPQWSDKFVHVFSASGWAVLACAAWTLLCASLLLQRIVPQAKSFFVLSGVGSVFVLVAAIGAAVLSSGDLDKAVVIDKKAAALISPFPAAQTVFSPAPGETVTVVKAYNDFLLVTDPAGHSGWINKSQITPIVPGHSA